MTGAVVKVRSLLGQVGPAQPKTTSCVDPPTVAIPFSAKDEKSGKKALNEYVPNAQPTGRSFRHAGAVTPPKTGDVPLDIE